MSFAQLQIEVEARRAQKELDDLRTHMKLLEKEIQYTNKSIAGMERTAARQGAALDSLVSRTNNAEKSTGRFSKGLSQGIPRISRWGNQIQWAGRQLQYNFALPIALAGGMAMKFALDNEKATTRIKKVYGDAGHDADYYKTEIDALSDSFEKLSGAYGISQAETLNIAASWAAAGSSGLALAKQTDLTMQTMILGEMDAASATEALIAIQAQYRQSSDDLVRTIEVLNMTENQTGVSMQGLVQGFQRAAGVASSYGVDVEHLAAMMAALTPATGSASNAGNALKTIITRLMNPTKDAAQVMEMMGINTASAAWQSLNATKRVEVFAKAYDKLNGAQKAAAAATVAGVYQVNRANQLFKEFNNEQGYYHKALKQNGDDTAIAAQRLKELNQVLQSNPQQIKILVTQLQNLAAKAIAPLIPHLIYFAQKAVDLMQKFAALDPATQKLIIGFVAFIAIIGPVARYVGAVANMFGLLGSAGRFLLKPLGLLTKGFGLLMLPLEGVFKGMSKVRAGISGVAGGIKTDLGAIFKGTAVQGKGPLLQAFAVLPKGAKDAMKAAKGAIGSGATKLWEAIPMSAKAAMTRTVGVVTGGLGGVQGKMMAWAGRLGPWLVSTLGGIGNVAFGALFVGLRKSIDATPFMKGLDRIVIGFLSFRGRLAAVAAGIGPSLLRGLVWLYSDLPRLIGQGFRALPALIGRGIGGIATAVSRLFPMLVANFAKIIPWTLRFLTSWWGLAITVAIGLIYNFRGQIANAWNSVVAWFKGAVPGIAQAFNGIGDFFSQIADFIVRQFWKLPDGITSALITVVKIVQQAAMQVYEWFSYLNPWAHHSPSLVESVNSGMAAVKSAYGSVGNIGSVFAKAANDLKQFKAIAAGLKQVKLDEQMGEVGKGLPQALSLYKALRADMAALNNVLAAQGAAVARQQAVVDRWKKALDAADAALDRQQLKLDSLQRTLDSLQAAYDKHAAMLETYSQAPIKGMGQMSDAIFANELAQKKLRLEMLKWEQVNGPIEDTQNKLASLAGDIEQLSGQANNLRAMGAGSDILGPINAQIDAMKAQQKALSSATGGSTAISEMQKKMDALAKQGEILQLQNDIKFDPLTRQIDKLANAEKEMSYTDIINGIKGEQAAMAKLQPQIDAATAAVDKQKAAVDAASAARDAINARYDTEQNKLQQLKDAYDQTESSIRDIESALNDMGSAASENIQKAADAAAKAKAAKKGSGADTLGPGATNFKNAAGATDFPSVQGKGGVGREGGTAPQGASIKDWTSKRMDELKQNLGKFDPFKPFKDAWNKAWKWMEDNVQAPIQNIIGKVQGFFSGIHISIPNPFAGTGTWAKNFQQIWATIQDIGRSAVGGLKHVWDLFKDDFAQIWDGIRNAFMRAWKKIGPELVKFKEPLSGIGEAFKGLWTLLKPLVGLIGVVLVGALKIVTAVFANVFGPVLNMVVDIITAVIKVIRGIVTFLVGTFRGDLGQALDGIGLIFGGMWDAIWAVFKGAGETLWGIFQGIVEGIVKWAKWLADIIVGHSIIPDMIKAIVDWFSKLPGWIAEHIKAFIGKVVQGAKDAWDGFFEKAAAGWNNIIKFFSGLPQSAYDNLIKLKDKIGNVASEAWDWFWTREKAGWGKIIDWFKGLPKNAYDNLIKFKDKIGNVASEAWDWFWTREKNGWSKIITWFKGLPKNAYDNLIAFKDKIGNVAKEAWDWFWTREKSGWSNIITWFKGLPKSAYDNLIALKTKIGDVAKAAFDAFINKAKDIIGRDSKHGFMAWIAGIPGRIASGLGTVGGKVADGLKIGWNAAAKWINTKGVSNVNKALKLFNVNIPELPYFATGGVIPGKATKKDNTIIAARSGEGVIVPELVRALGGAQGLAMLNSKARSGQLRRSQQDIPHFKDGGVVGKVGDMLTGIGDNVNSWLSKGTGFALDKILAPFEPAMRTLFPGKPFVEDWFVGVIKEWRSKAKTWGENKDKGAFGGGGDFAAHSGNAKANQAIAQRMLAQYGWGADQFKPLVALWNGESGWNQFARNPSSGAYGIPQSLPAEKMATAGSDWRTNPATQIKWGMNYIKSVYSTPLNALMKWNARSPHWYDKGGIMPPGMTLAKNGTGKDELVLTNADATALSNVLSMMDRMVAKSPSTVTPGAAAVRSMSATITSLEARLRAQDAKASQTTRSTAGSTVIYINGDLVMPNIKSGNDAEAFIKNLKNLAG